MKLTRQVAALPWRHGGDGIEILLVTTRTTKRWVIPKGWPMDGKQDHEAAAIEAYEEAGVRGRMAEETCGRYSYRKISDRGKARVLTVAVYPLHVEEELAEWPEHTERQRRWMTCLEACRLTGEAELVSVLRNFADGLAAREHVQKTRRPGFWQRLLAMFR